MRKAIVPVAGSGTRFLPLTKSITKEFLPLGEKSLLHHCLEELVNCGLEGAVLVGNLKNKALLNNFLKSDSSVKSKLQKENKKDILKDLELLDNILEKLSLDVLIQKKQNGDGGAVLFAKNYVKDDNFAVLFPDDVIIGQEPPLFQMEKVFKNMQKPVIGIFKVPSYKRKNYGIVKVEKIANRFYKILDIEEKPENGSAGKEDFAIVGRYILTPDIFDYIKGSKAKNGEQKLSLAFKDMIKSGKIIYGYEIKGDWLECGNKNDYIKSFIKYSLTQSEFKDDIKEFIKGIKY